MGVAIFSEKSIVIVYKNGFINETDFVYDPEEIKKEYGDDYVIPADEWNVIQTAPPAKINKQDKERLIS